MKKVASIFLGSILFFFLVSEVTHAGFGITPPYVQNSSLTRNSVYEQRILLVRSDPRTPLKATISLDVPGINDWFEILEGNEFLLPAGEQKVPMTVRVTVPDNAKFQQYLGNIRIKTGAPDDAVDSGAVSISLGAQVDVDLNVIDKEIREFKIRKIGISDLNEGHKVGWLYYPGRIIFEMLLENTGNVAVAPSEVVFRIYDASGNVLLEETTQKGKIEKVDPFDTKTIFAHLPTRLPSGSYLARFEIRNGEEVKSEGELNVSILPYGTLQTAGFGFTGLSIPHKLSVVIPILFVLGVIGIIFLNFYSRRSERK
ncbi:hypothetical protein OAD26_00465 [bacterium]|nr:hypothetical protein [bacterium]